jgi:outer membrane protein assembly factor BamB
MGGTFGRINGVIRNNLAAVTDTGTLLPLSADLDGWVRAITTTPAGSRLIVGGGFSHVNGQTHRAIVSLDSSTGAIRPWAATIPTCSEVTTLIHDSSRVYVGGEGTGGGCFDGFFASNPDTGREVWRDNCRGATQALVLLGGVLYVGSHAHNCGSVLCGGFGETSPRHLLAVNSADGCISSTWRPNTNGKPLGPYALATDGRRLFVGGDFTSVNNLAQQGFTRFG